MCLSALANLQDEDVTLETRAKQGDAEACHLLAKSYDGYDTKKAFKYYQKAWNLGDTCSAVPFAIGNYYARVKYDKHKAMPWFMKAAEKGNSSAQLEVAKEYSRHGGFFGEDFNEAMKWYLAALDQNKLLKNRLSYAEENVAMEGINFLASYRKIPKAMVILGQKKVRNSDYESAIKWFDMAAKQNDGTASCCLGLIYEFIKNNAATAVNAYKKSAELGNPYGCGYLGKCYLYGCGVAKDYERAFMLLTKASEGGADEFDVYIGVMYAYGYHVEKDGVKAFKLLSSLKYMTADFSNVMNAISSCYAYGIGTQADHKESAQWKLKSSQGSLCVYDNIKRVTDKYW